MPPVVPSTDSPHPHPESEPLNVDPDVPLSPSNDDDMGYDEQFLKPEGRPGDAAALWAASVGDHSLFLRQSVNLGRSFVRSLFPRHCRCPQR